MLCRESGIRTAETDFRLTLDEEEMRTIAPGKAPKDTLN